MISINCKVISLNSKVVSVQFNSIQLFITKAIQLIGELQCDS